MNARYKLNLGLVSAVISTQAIAWGPNGHQTIATIAAQLIHGTAAETQSKALLGDITLADAAVWADCAKGVDPAKNYEYQKPGKYPECKVFETPELEAEMSDFVRRNDKNCQPKAGEQICHKQYHYSDIAIQQGKYALGPVGTREDDVVAAVAAAIHVLKGDPSPAPFDIKDKREALLLMAHYAGDIHQPLHVGAIYLDAQGVRINPDNGAYDPKTATRGGNSILVKGKNLHSMWDAVPTSMTASKVNAAWLSKARAIPADQGSPFDWPATWATGTLNGAQRAFQGVKFGPISGGHWNATLPTTYSATMSAIKKNQLTVGGAHLAELLQSIWP